MQNVRFYLQKQNSHVEVYIDEDKLFTGWWSILSPYYYFYEFLPSKFPILYYTIANLLLIIVCITIAYPLSNFCSLISNGDEKSTIFNTYVNITGFAKCLFIIVATFASTYTIYFLKLLNSLRITNNKSWLRNNNLKVDQEFSMNQNEIRPLIWAKLQLYSKNLFNIFWNFFCFSWLFTLLISLFYSHAIPALHPDIKVQSSEWWFPMLYPVFLMNFVHTIYLQIFWIISYKLEQLCKIQDCLFKQFEIHFETEQRFRFFILEEMRSSCKISLSLTEKINNKIGLFVSTLIIYLFNGIVIPINQLKNLWKNSELTSKHFVVLMLWISASLFLLCYSLFRSIKISVEYSNTVRKFRIFCGAQGKLFQSKEFEKEVSSIL
jgi:hypothetical protein